MSGSGLLQADEDENNKVVLFYVHFTNTWQSIFNKYVDVYSISTP